MRWGSVFAGAAGAMCVVIAAHVIHTGWERHTMLADLAKVELMTSGSVAAIPKSGDGHFWAEANINGAPVRTLVDTGSTLVALTRRDAELVGLSPETLSYAHPVDTAAGRVSAAQVRLPVMKVGGIEQRYVDAIIVPEGLQHSLLGMSFLSRLSGFEATRDGLYLMQ